MRAENVNAANSDNAFEAVTNGAGSAVFAQGTQAATFNGAVTINGDLTVTASRTASASTTRARRGSARSRTRRWTPTS